MKVIFLHNNCPGQFDLLCRHVLAHGHEVVFISHYGQLPPYLGGAKHVVVPKPSKKSQAGISSTLISSQTFLGSLLRLKDSCWIPDLIISHSGFGCGLFAKEVFPSSRLVSYIEWCHNSKSYNNLCDSYDGNWAVFPETTSSSQLLSSLTMLSECQSADICVVPTNWQRQTLDKRFSSNIVTLHEGIDTTIFDSIPHLPNIKPAILYASRGFEAIRGFPDFVSSLPILDKLISQPIDVHVVGGDQIHYGVKSKGIPAKTGAHRYWAINELRKYKYSHLNIVIHDKLPFKKYLRMISICNVVVNTSLSFIPSWSLLQAILSRRNLVAHGGPMNKSVLGTSKSAHYFHSFAPNSIANCISNQINSENRSIPSSIYNYVRTNYAWNSVKPKWSELIF